MPERVQERWFEAKKGMNLSENDQVVTIDMWIDWHLGNKGTNLHDINDSTYHIGSTDAIDNQSHDRFFIIFLF